MDERARSETPPW